MRRYRDTTTILVRRMEERCYRRDRRTSFQRGIRGISSMTGFSLSELLSLRSLKKLLSGEKEGLLQLPSDKLSLMTLPSVHLLRNMLLMRMPSLLTMLRLI